MSGMTSKRLAEILMDALARDDRRANLPDPSADLSRRERDAHALLAHVDHLTAENAQLRAGIEAIRDEAWEPWLNRDWQHLDGIRNDCDALLNPPTKGETDE